jgi:RNA-splicing ligase RtcB
MMSINYFVPKELIPDDGSLQRLDKYAQNVDFSKSCIYIYPDVHYKKGARSLNGMLIKSSDYIFPACLGVENCGFTFGKIIGSNKDELIKSFAEYSKLLKPSKAFKSYSNKQILDMFEQYLKEDMQHNTAIYNFCKIKSFEDAKKRTLQALTYKLRKRTRKTLCSLGGGNHFFELHEVIDSKNNDIKKGDFIFILHSDSISFGEHINLRFSNLSELDGQNGFKGWTRKIKIRIEQLCYFFSQLSMYKDVTELFKLLYSQDDYRTIRADSNIGRTLIFEHNIARLFGEMNRNLIIKNWAMTQNVNIEILGSHCHDGVTIENNNIYQRNGVQYIGKDKFFMLPSAMGTYSYILSNTNNESAMYSANHGTGRFQDKHIAKANYNDKDTINELSLNGIKLFHIGNGSMAEQNHKAFKDVDSIILIMTQYNLGIVEAKTMPFAIIKG